MRVAVLSDIHGFDLAFDRVLTDIEEHGPFDHVVVTGDLCEGGPAPEAVLARLHEENLPCVMGNTDRDLATGAHRSATAEWTRQQIGSDGVAYLGALPFAQRIKPAPNLADTADLLVVHANPQDLDRHMRPDASDREIEELINDAPCAAIAFGHLHIPYVRQVAGRVLADISSVGNPKDGDLRCAWGSIAWREEDHTWHATIHRVPYPVEETVDQIRRSGIPAPERLIESLLRASY